jgi:hypothetical protein
MANWIKCAYYETGINDMPLNLEFVESIDREDETAVKFSFKENPPVIWKFTNERLRELEFERALSYFNAPRRPK